MAQVLCGVLLVLRPQGLVLLHQGHDGHGLLGVVVGNHDGLLVVVHAVVDALGGILGHGDGREHLLYLCLGAVHVDVAHHDDGLQVGAVPLVVIVAQNLVGEVVHHRHQTDGHAVAGTTVGHQCGQLAVQYTHLCRIALAPLLVDDATLLVNLLLIQGEVATPVVQDQQDTVHCGGAGSGYIIYIIYGLIDGSVGIQLLAELHADALQVAQQGIAGIVLGTVEAHVLQEVGQAALLLFLLNGAYLLCNVEIGLSGSLQVLADIIGKAIGQLALACLGILWQRLCADTCNHAKCQQK